MPFPEQNYVLWGGEEGIEMETYRREGVAGTDDGMGEGQMPLNSKPLHTTKMPFQHFDCV
jgi:hypothetical protein